MRETEKLFFEDNGIKMYIGRGYEEKFFLLKQVRTGIPFIVT